jgi:glutaredoxin-like YruB-family protein
VYHNCLRPIAGHCVKNREKFLNTFKRKSRKYATFRAHVHLIQQKHRKLFVEEAMPTTNKPQPRVIVFSTPTCTYCNAAKRYFREKHVQFKDVDVTRDAAAARDMVRRSGQSGVPVIDIGGKVIVGFDRPKIDTLLGLK